MSTAGGHGAGLTNMLLMPPHASVVEFPLKPHVDRCYGHMALALGLDYWIVPQLAANYHLSYIIDDAAIAAVTGLVSKLLRDKGLPAFTLPNSDQAEQASYGI